MGATAALSMQAASMFAGLSANRQEANRVKSEGKYVEGVSSLNAQLAEGQAADATARGAEAESRQRLATKGLIGSQRAALAASGVDANSGSAALLQEDSARQGALDALTIRNNAARQAWGYSVDAANARAQGQQAVVATDNTVNALNQKAYTTLLTGSAGLADQWRQNPPTFGRSKAVVGTPVKASSYTPPKQQLG